MSPGTHTGIYFGPIRAFRVRLIICVREPSIHCSIYLLLPADGAILWDPPDRSNATCEYSHDDEIVRSCARGYT